MADRMTDTTKGAALPAAAEQLASPTAAAALDALDDLEGAARGDQPFPYFAAPVIRAYIEASIATPPAAAGAAIPELMLNGLTEAETNATASVFGIAGDAAPQEQPPTKMIDDAVNRFLGWKLPATFAPDAGISFKPYHPQQTPDSHLWPVGTNLLTADEARAMFVHAFGGFAPDWSLLEATKSSLREHMAMLWEARAAIRAAMKEGT